ncbi:mechanosensitive ion channel [Hymenobacter sp. BT770]|uniref:mechanosensitive ion channel family protein n=1 Tax=Hymenobacter sp. BT770 TaxID=2886942 RepID=UPI001D122B21|nr:mechanosensitive ion channel domain-containing protein [Hymenobacter sp. BT770]MCC3155321.1 mechanosensitive ion channel family protein [Hymenobacter sp. BT770]MDO3417318.1 mechanosensitive ion channel [Hymenobacter sp. BT770]
MTHFPGFVATLGILLLGVVIGLVARLVISTVLQTYNRRANSELITSIRRHLRPASGWFFPALAVSLLLPLVQLPPQPFEVLRRLVEMALITTFAWGLVKLTDVVEDEVLRRYELNTTDNLRVRKLFTQLQFIKKLVMSLIVFVAVGLVLMSFETVRRLGTGLLTSAGIASVIVGFAAQRSISNLLAGFQIAFTQPIRIDDVLVVEGEWGRVEEITFTYVVLNIWDERRLVLPLNYFIEKPFQNWTRNSSQILGTVLLQTDYTVPVEAVRSELQRIVAASPLWDRRVCVLHVTDSKERTMELRALVSAANASDVWELRCTVREQLVGFLQREFPGSLPHTRAVVEGPAPVLKPYLGTPA